MKVEITIKGEPKEIAVLALELRERHGCHEIESIDGTALAKTIAENINRQTSSARTAR